MITPGQWVIHEGDDCTPVINSHRDGEVLPVATVDSDNVEDAVLLASAPDLLEACKIQHDALDMLFAMLIDAKPGFFPSKSGVPWEAMVKGNSAISKAGG